MNSMTYRLSGLIIMANHLANAQDVQFTMLNGEEFRESMAMRRMVFTEVATVLNNIAQSLENGDVFNALQLCKALVDNDALGVVPAFGESEEQSDTTHCNDDTSFKGGLSNLLVDLMRELVNG